MRIFLVAITLFITVNSTFGQSENESFFYIPEFTIGKTMEANDMFPKTNLQTGLFINFGRFNYTNDKDWAVQLNYPKTGVSIGITDFGNSEKLGQAYSVIPFIEYSLGKKWNVYVGMGGSYSNTLYDEVENPFNRAITTRLNWTFKSFLHHDLFKGDKIDWRLGLGYIHHSNGHSRLPNQGLNSFLASFSALVKSQPELNYTIEKPEKSRSSQTYFSGRIGFGQNVLSEEFNDKKGVYSIAVSAGKVINKTFRFGGGFYYRFYQQ